MFSVFRIENGGEIYFVELVGSERIKKSGATGLAWKEAQRTSQKLSAVGDVLQSLYKNEKFIPYRNSMVTQILQDKLGETSKSQSVILLNVKPYGVETLSTLRFATRIIQSQKKRKMKKFKR